MNLRTSLLTACAALGASGLFAQPGQPTTQSADAHTTLTMAVTTPEVPVALIEELEAMWEAGKTRLHPDYIWSSLTGGKPVSEGVADAIAWALEANSREAKKAVIEALELQFIHDPNTSTVDLLGTELSKEHFRIFEWHENDFQGGPEGPNEQLADIMVDGLDLMRPERRANRSRTAVLLRPEMTEEMWTFVEEGYTPIPGEDEHMLNRHAVPSYVRMREAAKKDGVELAILDAHRSRTAAERGAARAGNPNAVASFSSHSLGLAIDFKMSHGDFEIDEASTRPMDNLVRMRQSPVHKWLFLKGEAYGWNPYQNEPWHWEFNPPGFRERFFEGYGPGAPERAPGAE